MTFDPNIPRNTDIMSDSQTDLQTNFTQINSVMGIDHVAFDATANRGKHNKVTLVTQGSTDPETTGNELALYSRTNGSNVDVYFRGENNADPVPLTQRNETFLRTYPVFAVNYEYATNTSFSALNLNTVDVAFLPTYIQFNYTNQVLNSSGAAEDNYLYWATAVASSAYVKPVVARAPVSGPSIRSTYIRITVVDEFGTPIPVVNLFRLIVICWKVQIA